MCSFYLGIDTSCYTTSLSIVSKNLEIIFDERIILDVPINKNGLRQSEMLFQHMNNIPKLFSLLKTKEISTKDIVSIGITNRPRNLDSSYMPVFLAGLNFGDVIANSLNINTCFLSHQENHIYAAALGANYDYKKKHISVHMSGGTTEILLSEYIDDELKLTIIGGTRDISFGQLVDRIGVHNGLKFPCGSKMDEMSSVSHIKTPKVKTDGYFNISGMENYFKNLKDMESSVLFHYLFRTISNILKDSIVYLCKLHDIEDVILVGGVSSNSTIQSLLPKELISNNIKCYISDSKYCSDGAIGSAYYALIKNNK